MNESNLTAVHLLPRGQHPWSNGTETYTLNLDDQALQSIVANFEQQAQPLLIDYDHLSHEADQTTTAAGWIDALEVREDGLWGKARWSAQGSADVQGGMYRYLSATLDRTTSEDLGEGVLRPTRLLDCALTNKPSLPVQPLAEPNEEEVTEATAEEAKPQPDEQLQTLESEVQALKEALAERDLQDYAIDGEAREVWKQVLMSNRQQGLKALAMTLRKVEARAPLHNRSSATAPFLSQAERMELQRRTIDECRVAHHCTYREAFALAQRQRPELFQFSTTSLL